MGPTRTDVSLRGYFEPYQVRAVGTRVAPKKLSRLSAIDAKISMYSNRSK